MTLECAFPRLQKELSSVEITDCVMGKSGFQWVRGDHPMTGKILFGLTEGNPSQGVTVKTLLCEMGMRVEQEL